MRACLHVLVEQERWEVRGGFVIRERYGFVFHLLLWACVLIVQVIPDFRDSLPVLLTVPFSC